jgi:hypothetical protein
MVRPAGHTAYFNLSHSKDFKDKQIKTGRKKHNDRND